MATDIEVLTAVIDANTTKWENKIAAMTTSFDRKASAIEARNSAMTKKMDSSWDAVGKASNFLGIDKATAAITGLTAVGVVGGIADLVKKSLDAASAIGDTARQAGVGVEKLQELRFAASQSGATMADLDEGLITLNRNMGEFVNTGAGRAAAAFKQLGLSRQALQGMDSGQVFDVIASKINKFGSEAQKSSLLAKTLGTEAGPKLLQMAEAGQAGLERLAAQAHSLGIVLSTDTVKGAKEADDKLDALFSTIKSQGVAALTQFAPQIASLADSVTKSLPDLIKWVEKFGELLGLVKLSPVDHLKLQIDDATASLAKLQEQKDGAAKSWTAPLNAFGSIFGLGTSQSDFDVFIKSAKDKLLDLQHQLAAAEKNQPKGDAPPKPKGKAPPLQMTDEEKALEQQRKDFMAKTLVDAKTAEAAWISAQDSAAVEQLKGLAGYHDAVVKQIQDERQARLDVIQAEQDKSLEALDKLKLAKESKKYKDAEAQIATTADAKRGTVNTESDAALVRSGPDNADSQIAKGQLIIQGYKDQQAAIGATVGELARQQYYQELINADREKGITLTQAEIEQNPQLKAKADAIAAIAQQTADANLKLQDSQQLAGVVADGLNQIGVAGLHGFGSMKEAAGQFLETLAETIIQLEVMGPILKALHLDKASISAGGDTGFLGVLSDIGSALGFADGGVIQGPGGPRSDSIVARVSPGEYIVNAASTKRNRPLLDAINSGGGLARFADGGYVGAVPAFSTPTVPSVQSRAQNTVVVVQHFDLSGAVMTQDLMRQMDQRSAAQAHMAATTAVITSLQPHILGPAMNKAKSTRHAR